MTPRHVRALIESALDELAGPGQPWPWSSRVSLLIDAAVAREEATG